MSLHERRFQLADRTRLGLEGHPLYSEDYFYLPNVDAADAMLGTLLDTGLIDHDRPRRVLDWGAGIGSSTLALAEFATRTGGTVTAVEKVEQKARELAKIGLLPEDSVHWQDGLVFLEDAVKLGVGYDLIAACMYFDGETNHEAHRAPKAVEFVGAARQALAPGGVLAVYSDPETMESFEMRCLEAGVDFQLFHLPATKFSMGMPDFDLVVVSAEAPVSQAA